MSVNGGWGELVSMNGGAELVSRDGGGAGVGEGKTGVHAWKRGSWYQE